MVMEEWIKVVCEGCSVKLKIQDDFAGKRGKCPKCKTRFPIPTIEDEITIIEDDIDAIGDEFDIEKDLLMEFAEIDKEIEAKEAKENKKKADETQEVKHNWDSATKIDMEEEGL